MRNIEKNHELESKTLFGFWIYIMTDCVLFASLFAVFAVMRSGVHGAVPRTDIFDLSPVLTETLILLTSSLTIGLALLALNKRDKQKILIWLTLTFGLGLMFLELELLEFRHLIINGNGWRASGFLSSFFALVATHGLHILIGLIWIVVMYLRIARRGLTATSSRRLLMLGLYWHFLDIIWIFIFSVVYLLGAAKL